MESDKRMTEVEGLGQEQPGDILSAYNEAAGTLNLQQDGLNAQTQMRNDGRVDILINETNTRLADQLQRLQMTVSQEPGTLSPAYTVSDLHGRSAEAPPPLNIVIQVVGSRGDVQPFVALAKVLKRDFGHRIRLATHGTFKKFVEDNDLEFFDIGGDPSELMAFMVKNPGLIPGMKSLKAGEVGKRRKGIAKILQGCWRSCADADEVRDEHVGSSRAKAFVAHAIIANPPSFAHIHCAEKLGIPLHIMFTMPWSPTRDFPHPIANIKSSNANGSMTNEMSYTLVEMLTWQGLGDIINEFRTETLDLVSLSQAAATTMLDRLRVPFTYCWSPALIPKPKDWGPHITISGFYFLSLASNYQPDPELAAFLAAGPPPVYIGFGSIVVDDPEAMTKMIFEAVETTGQRALVSKGWGGLGGDDLGKPDNIFMLGNCPHDWLFHHVSCVVHHGGAGTMAAGIALGRPTVIVPFFGDQPFWGAMVARAGAGPSPIPYKELTADGLANAILHALKPETLERAKELGERIREENGCETGAASFHAHMNIDRLRCLMASNRPAVWRVKTLGSRGHEVRLSAFAAAVLGNEGLLDLNQLELYRPCEYEVAEGAMAANMAGANPILGTFGSIASGIAHWPINVGKAYAGVVYQPYKGARKEGWKGFGKGLGKGFSGVLFPMRGFVVDGRVYGIRGLYHAIKTSVGSNKLSFILAANFALGFEEVRASTEEERIDVLRKWEELGAELELQRQTTSGSSAFSRLMHSSSGRSNSTSLSQTSTRRSKKEVAVSADERPA